MRLLRKSKTFACNETFITLARVALSLKLLILGSILAVSTGCATVVVRDPDNRSHFPACYPATIADVRCGGWALTGANVNLGFPLGSGNMWALSPLFLAGALIDLPLSVVVDTLVLPFDLVANARNKRITQATQTAVKTIWAAVAVFKKEHGRFPSNEEGLAVLTPTYLEVLPTVLGRSFRYLLVDGCPVINCAGSDKRFDAYRGAKDAIWYPESL
jgi:uncharacterized protein YceK